MHTVRREAKTPRPKITFVTEDISYLYCVTMLTWNLSCAKA